MEGGKFDEALVVARRYFYAGFVRFTARATGGGRKRG